MGAGEEHGERGSALLHVETRGAGRELAGHECRQNHPAHLCGSGDPCAHTAAIPRHCGHGGKAAGVTTKKKKGRVKILFSAVKICTHRAPSKRAKQRAARTCSGGCSAHSAHGDWQVCIVAAVQGGGPLPCVRAPGEHAFRRARSAHAGLCFRVFVVAAPRTGTPRAGPTAVRAPRSRSALPDHTGNSLPLLSAALRPCGPRPGGAFPSRAPEQGMSSAQGAAARERSDVVCEACTGTVDLYHQHIFVFTGDAAWPARVEDKTGGIPMVAKMAEAVKKQSAGSKDEILFKVSAVEGFFQGESPAQPGKRLRFGVGQGLSRVPSLRPRVTACPPETCGSSETRRGGCACTRASVLKWARVSRHVRCVAVSFGPSLSRQRR